MHWTSTHPKARVSHRCVMCGRTVHPGETYLRTAAMGEGTAWTWKECVHCAAFVQYAYGISWHEDSYGEELLIEFEPKTVAQARVRAQHRRQWRRRDGSLYPVPHVVTREDSHGFGRRVDILPGDPA